MHEQVVDPQAAARRVHMHKGSGHNDNALPRKLGKGRSTGAALGGVRVALGGSSETLPLHTAQALGCWESPERSVNQFSRFI